MLSLLRIRRIFPDGLSWQYAVAYAVVMVSLLITIGYYYIHRAPPIIADPGLIDTDGLFLSDELDLAMEMPPAWITTPTPTGLIFSGPTGSTSYFTTITLQALAEHDTTLDHVFEDTYGDLARDPNVLIGAPVPILVAGMPALAFALETSGYKTPRRKVGVLLDTGRHIVDISYSAPVDLFAESFFVYTHALESMNNTHPNAHVQ